MIPNFEEQKIHVHVEEASVTTVVRINLFSEGKIHELNRSHDESVAKSLVRIEKILSKSTTKSSSSKKDKNKTKRSHEISRESTSSTATLWKSGCLLNSEIILNKDLSEEILLSINNIHYSIERNPPNVESVVVFPTRQYFCNSPIVITAINKYPNDEIIYSWFLQDPSLNVGYTFIAEGCEFTPSIDHLGCKIKVYCTPARHVSSTHERRGRSVALYLHGTIQASLCDPSMVLVRQDFIAARIADEKSNQLRIVTYNILAETFATNTYAQKILYRYCPAKYLDTDYRMSLVQAELLAYEADVICLQECDYKVFNLYFRPLFQAREYSCHHTCKSSGNQEGCAIFISHKNLRVIQYVDVTLKDYLRAHTDLNKELFTTHPDVANILCEQLGNIVQIAVCERVGHPDQVVLIANTHLFYHKLASYVRLLQTNAIVEILSFIRNHVLIHGSDSVVDSFLAGAESTKCNHIDCHSSSSVSATATTTADSEGKRSDDVTIQTMSSLSLCPGVRSVATIFAGDLNSTPSSAATEYMTS